MRTLFLFTLTLMVLSTSMSYAACTLPAGNASAILISTIQTPSAGYAPAASVNLNEGVILYDQSDNTLKICDGSNWQSLGGSGGSGPSAVIADVKASNTNAQNIFSTWTARDMNTELYDPNNLITISANTFTPSVNGVIDWDAPGRDSFSSRLVNVTDNNVAARGTSAASGGGSISLTKGFSTVTAGKAYRIDQITNNPNLPGGYATPAADGNEVYTVIRFYAN